jgi:hypothetical protein
VNTTTAARSTVAGSVVRMWSTSENVATAETARVMAREYGPEAFILACAFWMREAEMSSIARVTFFVVCAERILWR